MGQGDAPKSTGSGRAGAQRNGSFQPNTTTCDFQDNLTWNTAPGGVPTLAVDDLSAETTDEGWTDFITGPRGLPLEQLANGDANPKWYYQDFQGNTRALVDASDNIAVQNYPPYGIVTNPENSGPIGTPLQYSGAYTTGWMGLVDDQARWYDPPTGQFLSTDPEATQTLQPYAYAGDNPANNSDPTGDSATAPSEGCHYPKGVVARAGKWCDARQNLETWVAKNDYMFGKDGPSWDIHVARASGSAIASVHLCFCGKEADQPPQSFWTFAVSRGNSASWPREMWRAGAMYGPPTNEVADEMLKSSPQHNGDRSGINVYLHGLVAHFPDQTFDKVMEGNYPETSGVYTLAYYLMNLELTNESQRTSAGEKTTPCGPVPTWA